MKEGDKIRFTYHNRKVEGTIQVLNNRSIVLILETDYCGKNEEWYVGEKKRFNISEMKRITTKTK